MFNEADCKAVSQNSDRIILWYSSFISLSFFVFSIVLCLIYNEGFDLLKNLFLILTSPCKLVTDYFALGSVSATFLNASICGFVCNLMMRMACKRITASTFAGYLLVIAHCFFGLNFFNMWPTILGVFIFCKVTKRCFGDNLNIAMVSTALGPFISDFTFRYFETAEFDLGHAHFSFVGFIVAIIFGIISGFLVPALIPGTSSMHRNYSLYKAGLAIGIMGIFVYSFMYPTLGVETPKPIVGNNTNYSPYDPYHYLWLHLFFFLFFAITLLFGYFLNGKSFKGYKKLLKSTGYGVDFIDKFGAPVCLINFAVYGLCIFGYFGFVSLLPYLLPIIPDGTGLSGATVGVVFGALTFSFDGQHPKNVWPIGLGYLLLFALVCAICAVEGAAIPWTISSQTYINSFAFATGLCPFAGKYGWKIGVVAGFACATICCVTASIHGGFVLYNGGFTAGLTALILLPILDFYGVKERFDTDI